MSEPLEAHGYVLDFDALVEQMWELAEGSDDGEWIYSSHDDRAMKWLIAEMSGTPAESGVTLDANDALRQQAYERLESEGWAERLGQRRFRMLRYPGVEESRHILCTWNPGPDDSDQYTHEEWDEFVESVDDALEDDNGIRGRWSVGRRVRGIDPGDTAYLLRQGVHGRGIVATGTIRSTPYSAEDWRGDRDSAQYVDIEWTVAVPLDEMLPTETLEERLPEVRWDTIPSSGREVKGTSGNRLHDLWLEHLRMESEGEDEDDTGKEGPVVVVVDPTGKPVGAGFGSAEQNAKVEAAAMRVVIEAYEADGWTHRDVSKDKCGWDVTFSKSGEEHHVEIKGVAGMKTECFVTANEIRKARKMSTWRLAIVTGALGDDPQYYDVDREVVIDNAAPSIYRVKVPRDAFE